MRARRVRRALLEPMQDDGDATEHHVVLCRIDAPVLEGASRPQPLDAVAHGLARVPNGQEVRVDGKRAETGARVLQHEQEGLRHEVAAVRTRPEGG